MLNGHKYLVMKNREECLQNDQLQESSRNGDF